MVSEMFENNQEGIVNLKFCSSAVGRSDVLRFALERFSALNNFVTLKIHSANTVDTQRRMQRNIRVSTGTQRNEKTERQKNVEY
jgi:hypothetical protein